MKFRIDNSVNLLKPEYFVEEVEGSNSQFFVSVFADSAHNFIVPNASFISVDVKSNQEIIAKYRDLGKEFSYYVPKEYDKGIVNGLKESGLKYDYTIRYVYKEISEEYKIEDKEIITLNPGNLDLFIEAAGLCFPGWNNREFTEWCLSCPAVDMFAVMEDGMVVAFAGYFKKPEHNYVLLMNAGTIPDYRRRGLHEYMIKMRANIILREKGPSLLYSDVDNGEASHKGFIKLDYEDGPVFAAYN